MKNYKLGPNGGILTCLNLFASDLTHLNKEMVKKKEEGTKYFVIDTPGQIEVFNWSASGQIITQTLASDNPTVMLFIIDLVRCENPNSFMSSMLFCLSLMFRLRLPLLIVFNKSDCCKNRDTVVSWLTDYESLLVK